LAPFLRPGGITATRNRSVQILLDDFCIMNELKRKNRSMMIIKRCNRIGSIEKTKTKTKTHRRKKKEIENESDEEKNPN